MKIVLLHYSCPPVIGGVESVLQHHARFLSKADHQVKVLCGSGRITYPGVEFFLIPELAASHPGTIAAQTALRNASGDANFSNWVDVLYAAISPHLRNADVVCAHNLLTMPFNLAATHALAKLAEAPSETRFISWIHDLAACNPDYDLPSEPPWSHLRSALPGFQYVAVSRFRQKQFMALTGSPAHSCTVIPNGIDGSEILNLTPAVARFASSRELLTRDTVLLCPARLLKRKRLESALRVVAGMKEAKTSCACLITGAEDPHNLDSVNYARWLRGLVNSMGLNEEVFFVSDFFTVTNPDLVSLYEISDAVLYPSLQEGFGIPLLEAAVHRLPIFCSAIGPFREMAFSNVTTMDWDRGPSELAEVVHKTIKLTANCRKEVLNRFAWETIYVNQIEPFLKQCKRT